MKDIARELASALYTATRVGGSEDITASGVAAVHVSIREPPTATSTAASTAASTHPYVSLLHVHPEISFIDADGRVEFTNGEVLDNVDHILLCTGYSYHFPFFTETCERGSGASSPLCTPPQAQVYGQVGPRAATSGTASASASDTAVLAVTPRSVRGLYQHLLFSANPTLAFLGLPHTIVPFPLFYLQARYLASVYASGTHSSGTQEEAEGEGEDAGARSRPVPCFPALPSLEEREAWIHQHEKRISDDHTKSQSSGSDDNMYHNLGPKMWEYLQFLHQNSQSDPFISEQYLANVRAMYETVSSSRPKEIGYPDTYRDDNYEVDR